MEDTRRNPSDDSDTNVLKCFLLCGKPCEEDDSITNMSQERWDGINEKASEWNGLDKFGDVASSVDWEKGPTGLYMHKSCFMYLKTTAKLQQAKKRKWKQETVTSKCVASNVQNEGECSSDPVPKRLRSSIEGGSLHDKHLCIWCLKPDDTKHRDNKWHLVSTEAAWNAFKRHTVLLEEVAMRERIVMFIEATTDVFATEVRYHYKCWMKYITNPLSKLTDTKMLHLQHVQLSEVKQMFFEHVREVIFKEHEIRTLQGLLLDYQVMLHNYGCPSSDVKSSYIKDILTREFKECIGFHPRHQRNKSEIVYDTSGGGSFIEAAISSIGISDEQLVRNVAPRLAKNIQETATVPWPPHVDELEEPEDLKPLLLQFLTWLKKPRKKTADMSPETLSLASIITKYVTGKRTTATINLSVAVHGLTKSKEIVDILHKESVGISYADVHICYDFWALHDLKFSSSAPRELAENVPAIAIVDNDDFKMDTLTGKAPKAHRTNIMYIQKQSLEKKQEENTLRDSNAKQLSDALKELASEMCEVEPYKSPPGQSDPPVRTKNAHTYGNTSTQRMREVIHVLARADDKNVRPAAVDQMVPGYAGFQSYIHPPVEPSKAYYHMTYPKPPSKSILHDIMSTMTQAMSEKSIPYMVLVGDMPVYKQIVTLKCENEEKFENIIPFLAPFHSHMSFINVIYKRYKGSGISDLLVAAGVIADGSVDQALRGKHYRRAIRCLRLLSEALLQKRIQTLPAVSDLSASTADNLAILRKLDAPQQTLAESHISLEEDADLNTFVSEMFTDVEGSRMAEYWVSFLDMVDVLMMNIHAIHTGNWTEFISSMYAMLPWLLIYDNLEYGRWLPDFWAMLTSLPDEKINFLANNFAQSMTGLPYSGLALDLWIETTMNLGSKLKSGWINILGNEKQLLTNTRNANNISRIRAAVQRHVNNKPQKRKHLECGPSRRRIDEQAVQDLLACMEEFECDPFDVGKTILRTLQSAIPASTDLESDLQTALTDGETKLDTFMDERVYAKISCISDRIHKNSRLNFAKDTIAAPSGDTSKQKAGEMERNGLAAVVDLVEESKLMNLTEVMEHRITDECLAIFNVNGSFRKVQKSKLLEKFALVTVPMPHSYTALVDMGFVWRLATPTPEDREKRDGTPYTWGDYIEKIMKIILSRHANAETIVCINDPYDRPYSIKDDERDMRGQGPVGNVFMKTQDDFPSAPQFTTLLTNASNKIRLQALIKSELSKRALGHYTITQRILYSIGKSCTDLTAGVDREDLHFDQAEADTIIFSTYSKLRSTGMSDPCVIDSEDTDIYVQAAFVSHQLQGDLYLRRKRAVVSCLLLCPSEEMADILIAFHVLTGCDHNSGFYGHGKKTVYDKVERNPEARNLLSKCGHSLILSDDALKDLQKFILKYVYGVNTTCAAEARAIKWKQLKKKSTHRLPPDQDSLAQHCQRANYLAYIQMHFDCAEHPSPIDHGWVVVNGKCRPVRHTCAPLPDELPKCDNLASDSDTDYSTESDSDDDSESSSDNDSYFSDTDH